MFSSSRAARTLHIVSKRSASSGSLLYAPRLGLGGRQTNYSNITITVFGSYGFVGRYVMGELGTCGTRVYAPFRGDELEVRHLKPMFDLGQLGLLPFSPRDKDSIVASLRNSDVVINLIGKHYETKNLLPTLRENGEYSRVNYSFEEANVTTAETLAALAKEAGVKAFIQASALSADKDSASAWSRSKAAAEVAVKKHFPEAVIVKLATVFGAEDRFLNWIAEFSSRSVFFPLINGGRNLVQPVYAGDIGKGILEIIKNYDDFAGQSFQFVGPAEYSRKEVAEYVQDVTRLGRPLVDVPISWARRTGKVMEHFISPFWTEDFVDLMLEDAVKLNDPSLKTLQDLGVEPRSMDSLAFDYLHRFRKGGHFTVVKGYH